jgi:hypothetical protein
MNSPMWRSAQLKIMLYDEFYSDTGENDNTSITNWDAEGL